jgi:DNA primase
MDLPEQTLMNALNRLVRERYRKQRSDYVEEEIPVDTREQAQIQQRKDEYDPYDIHEHEKQLIRLMLLYGSRLVKIEEIVLDETGEEQKQEREASVFEYVIENLNADGLSFEQNIINRMLDEIKEKVANNVPLDTTDFVNHEDPEIAEATVNLLASPYDLSENWEKHQIYVKQETDDLQQAIMSIILPLRSKLIGRELKNISEEMKNTKDDGAIFVLQQRFYELKKVAAEIDGELKRPFNY